MSQTRQLAAIMFTDIVGYTALMGKDSNKALELIRISKEIQKPLVEKHNGKWLKEMGDGAMAQFSTALDAVNCSIEIQKTARGELDAKLRIGIHSGDITIEDDDVYGDGVNVASRLESIADPGGIYISHSIQNAIQGQTDVQAKYLGEVKLKNVDYGVRTYALQGVGLPIPDTKEEKEMSGRFLAELQRRGVIRAGLTYIVAGIFLILLLREGQSWVSLPGWSLKALVMALIAGVPLAIYLAWNFERSPQGFVRTTSQQSWQNPYKDSQKKPLTGRLVIAVLVLAVVFLYFFPQRGAQDYRAVPENSIAVMYFDNMSGDESQEYFSDGITEEIIARLSMIPDLKVISRTSMIPYKGKGDIKKIAEELEVRTILEGSVRRSDSTLRITALLIDAETGRHLWTEIFDKKVSDIFEIQSSVAYEIALNFVGESAEVVRDQIMNSPTENVQAYDLYLQAKALPWARPGAGIGEDTGSADKAVRFLKQALSLDPEYGQALALLSRIYGVLNRKVIEKEDLLDSAIVLAFRAINVNPDRPEGYVAFGVMSQQTDGDDAARYWFEMAEAVQPGSAVIELASTLPTKERMGLLLSLVRKEPRNPLPLIEIGWMYRDAGERQSALEYFQASERIAPENPEVHLALAYANFDLLVDGEGSINLVEKYSRRFFGSDTLGFNKDMAITHLYNRDWKMAETYYARTNYRDLDLGLVMLETNRRDSGIAILEKSLASFLQMQDRRWVMDGARIYAALGRNDLALELMGADMGNMSLTMFEYDPFLDYIRGNERFKALEAKYRALIKEDLRLMEEAVMEAGGTEIPKM